MKNTLRRIAVRAILLALIGCNRDTRLAESFHSTIRVDSSTWARLPRWSLEFRHTLCDGFSQASGCKILVDPQNLFADGDLFVFDKRQGLVELSDDGAYKRTWADLGDYPNGYREVEDIARFGTGGLLMWDPDFFQVTLYDRFARVLNRISLRTQGKPEWKGEQIKGLHLAKSGFVFLSVPSAENILQPVRGRFWRANPPDFIPKQFLDVKALSDRQAGADLQPPLPFVRPTEDWALTREGTVWYVSPDTILRLSRYSSNGEALTQTIVGIHPSPVSSEDVLKARDDRIRRILSSGNPSELKHSCRGSLSIQCLTFRYFDSAATLTKHYPLVDMLVAASDYGAWIETVSAHVDSARWTHIMSTGIPDGMVVLPRRLIIAADRQGTLLLRYRKPNASGLGIQFVTVRNR